MAEFAVGVTRETPVPGDFRAVIGDNTVYLPAALVQPLRMQGATTPTSILSYLQSFPSAAANMLGWSVADVQSAVRRLEVQLTGAVPSWALSAASHAEPTYGALNPALLRKSTHGQS